MAGGQVRILGVDPGSRVLGYGIVELSGKQVCALDSGRLSLSGSLSLADRLLLIDGLISELVSKFSPEVLALEEAFVFKNAHTALTLGVVRGAVMLSAARLGLEVFEYPPAVVKRAVVGYGRAAKGQVQAMVRVLLALDAVPSEDAADALAVALCHAWHINGVGADVRP